MTFNLENSDNHESDLKIQSNYKLQNKHGKYNDSSFSVPIPEIFLGFFPVLTRNSGMLRMRLSDLTPYPVFPWGHKVVGLFKGFFKTKIKVQTYL